MHAQPPSTTTKPGGYTLVCQVCGDKFKARYRGKHICDKPECKQKQARKNYLAYQMRHNKGIKHLDIVKTCPHCGKEFKPKRHNQHTCGSAQCMDKRHRELTAIRTEQVKKGIKPAPTPKFDKELRRVIEAPTITRNCLKCGKPFKTDVNWICDPCHEINAEIYML